MRGDSSSGPRIALLFGVGTGLAGCSLFVSLNGLDDGGNASVDAADDASDAVSPTGDSSTVDANTSGIVWRDTKSVAFGNPGTTFTLPTPMNQPNDVLVAFLALGSSGNPSPPVFTAPAGWTKVREIDRGNVSALVIYVHVASAAEPAQFTWTSSLDAQGESWLSAYSGVDPALPVAVDLGLDVNQPLTAYSTPALSAVPEGALLIASFAGHTATAVQWSAPPGMITRASLTNADTRSALSADTFQTVAGDAGPFTATVGMAQDYAETHLLALRPAP